jgi:hypothetical protein
MKRDWDVVRAILTAVEDRKEDGDAIDAIPDVSVAVFLHHATILVGADLVEGKLYERPGHEPRAARLYRLTWKGHEFLDSIRHKSVWDKVKANAEEKGLSLTFETIKLLATSVIKHKLGIDLNG